MYVFSMFLPLLRKKSSIFLARIVKAENGCGGTSTFFPFHLTSFILRAFCAQLTLYRTKRVVEVDQAESRKPFSLRSNTVLPSATTMLYFLCFYAHAAAAGTKSTNSRLSLLMIGAIEPFRDRRNGSRSK